MKEYERHDQVVSTRVSNFGDPRFKSRFNRLVNLAENFHRYPQFSQSNSGIVSQIMLCPLRRISLSLHYSLTIQLSDTTQSEIHHSLINNLRISRFWRVLAMVYNRQNYCVFLLFPSSGILENTKHDVSETGSVSVLRWRREKTPTQLCPLERAKNK
jgi:hypothetical protein